MNIAIDIRPLLDTPRTGVGEFTFEMIDALLKTDTNHQFFLFYSGRKIDKKAMEMWKYDHVHYVHVQWPNKLLSLMTTCKLIKLNQFIKQDIDWWVSPNIGFTHLSKSIKHVQVIHDLSFELYPECFSWKRRAWHKVLQPRRQARQADVVLTPSYSARRDVIDRFGVEADKVVCLYPGISSLFVENLSKLNEDTLGQVRKKYHLPKNYLLFLGTLEPRKNIEAIIDAFVAYKQDHPSNIKLVLAGPFGWKYKSIVKKIASYKDVMHIGYVDAKDKPALYRLAKVFIYPSLYEGFGFPVLEAQAAGTPVVTSNGSSLVEVADPKAYLVHPYLVSEIHKGIEVQIEGEKGYNSSIIQKFAWDTFAQEFLCKVSLYEA